MSRPSHSSLHSLVNHFKNVGNFDHFDMEEVARIGAEYGVSPLDAGRAFFVARELVSLHESEIADGGTGEEAKNTKPFGDESIDEMLFDFEKKFNK